MRGAEQFSEGELRHAADLALVQQYLAQDPGSREKIAERLRNVPGLLVVANRRLGKPLSNSDINDLSQDVVTRILEKIETFEGRATLETWVFRICHLELMNRMRKQDRRGEKKRPNIEDIAEPAQREPAANPSEYDELDRALRELGSPEEGIIRLKHYDGLTFDEIAEQLSMSANTAKTRYYRGMRWLRGYLGRQGGPA